MTGKRTLWSCIVFAFVSCAAVSSAAERPGANALASMTIADLPRAPIYWHLDTFPTRVAAEAAKGPLGAIVEAFGRVWLFTLAEGEWRLTGGERVATIGPGRRTIHGELHASRNPAGVPDRRAPARGT